MDSSPNRSIDGFYEFLVDNGHFPPEGVARLRNAARSTGRPIDALIAELALMKEEEVPVHLAYFLGSFLWQSGASTDNELVRRVGLPLLMEKAILPLSIDTGRIDLCVADPFDRETIRALGFFFDREPVLTIGARSEIVAALTNLSELLPREKDDTSSGEDMDFESDADRLQDIALSAPVVNLVNRLAQNALDLNASDIHIEPMNDRVQIRFRRDGILVPFETVSRSMLPGLVSRIKILSSLNIVERRIPQDGRMRLPVRGQEIDFRVSVVPSVHGETMVLRLLHNKGMALDLTALGYDTDARRMLDGLVRHSNGIVIVTGPTGSGKTTTLYSLVSRINNPETKIFTVEDPIEYRIDGITQVQVNPALGLDFAHALRALLRQDPDVILIGEIRDRETAQIAVQAALTGHLVLATLHTNSAVSALTRLRDMGIEAFLLAATIRGVVGQRLARTLCNQCAGQRNANCSECKGTGYSGRTVVYEILEVTQDISNLVGSGIHEENILLLARERGFVTMLERGKKLVGDGITSASEIARIAG